MFCMCRFLGCDTPDPRLVVSVLLDPDGSPPSFKETSFATSASDTLFLVWANSASASSLDDAHRRVVRCDISIPATTRLYGSWCAKRFRSNMATECWQVCGGMALHAAQ